MAIDHSNPNVVYAATYQRRRTAWGFNGGGPGSGIHKSVDGGRTWNELTNGLPAGDKGRIGIAVSESNPSVVMALVVELSPAQTAGPIFLNELAFNPPSIDAPNEYIELRGAASSTIPTWSRSTTSSPTRACG